ncbi:MAG: hypothetical protein ABL957_04160 [Parvularculaceae bacterium]
MSGMVRAGLGAGLAGGILDFAAASIVYPLAYPGLKIMRIWQSVAEGVLGKAAYDGGLRTAVLGAGLHFVIALCAGMTLAAVMSRAEIFRRLWPVSGALYGVSMYCFMQLVVLPLSQVGVKHPDAKALAIGLGIHILVFGLGSALVASRLLKRTA